MANAHEAVLFCPCLKNVGVFAQSTDCARTEEWPEIVCLQVGPLHILCRYRLTSSVRRHVHFL